MITYRLARLAACMVFVVPLSHLTCAAPGAEPMVLFSFHEGFDLGQVVPQDAAPSLVRSGAATLLQVRTGHAARWPGITLKAPSGHWDLSAFNHIALHITNAGSDPVAVHCRVDCPGGDGAKNSSTQCAEIAPGERLKLTVPLQRKLPAALAEKLFGMRGYPGGYGKDDGLDVSRITQLIVFVSEPPQDHVFELSDIVAEGTHEQGNWLSMTPDRFFPMIDRFGQFIHKDWPGKTYSEGDLARAIQTELADWDAHPGPSDWNGYGGWQSGPQLPATGFF